MSNLRRHFSFSLNKSTTFGSSGSGRMTEDNIPTAEKHLFFKSALMNDIRSSLNLCSAYIQALNSLCDAGTMLARSLLQTVHDVPSYRDVATQFLGAWEDVSKATAGASADVKTKTLIMLQDILNNLEGEGDHLTAETTTLAESIKVIGICLFSYIELQTQFSFSAWKSLSKLSKNLTLDNFGISLDRTSEHKSTGGDLNGNSKFSDLITTIKKHFAHLMKFGNFRTSDIPDISHSQFYVDVLDQETLAASIVSSESLNHQGKIVGSAGSPPTAWLPTNNFRPLGNSPVSAAGLQMQHSHKESSQKDLGDTAELDEVINLLSYKPGEQVSNKTLLPPESAFVGDVFGNLPPTQPWPGARFNPAGQNSSSLFSSLSAYDGKRTWPRVGCGSSSGVTFGYDNWIWGHFEPQFGQDLDCRQVNQQTVSNQKSSHDVVHNGNRATGWGNDISRRWPTVPGENGSSSDDASSNNGQENDVFSLGLDLVGRDLVASVRQRRHSSSDGLQDISHAEPSTPINKAPDISWEVRASKTSTWPLKQSSPRMTDHHLSSSVMSPPSPFPPPNFVGMWSALSLNNETRGQENTEKKYMLFGQPS